MARRAGSPMGRAAVGTLAAVADGIVSGPVDVERRRQAPVRQPLARALVVEHRASGIVGAVVGWGKGQVQVQDRRGTRHRLPLEDGGFLVEGRIATLTIPTAAPPAGPNRTASGS